MKSNKAFGLLTAIATAFIISIIAIAFVFLATNDSTVIRRGYRIDIAPTILKRLGVDLSQLEPPVDGHPLTERYEPAIW